MTAQEFLEEVLNSEICPENFEEIYMDFQHFQQAAIDTLNEFHRVCEKNGIHYQLAYGSLLGAIRDNGQIPWDYDVDVFVPYWEKDALIEALRRDMDQKYYFFCPESNPKCRHNFMRLAPKRYNTQVLHVDVFYYTGSAEEESERERHREEMRKAVKMRYNKLVNCREVATGNFRAFLSLLIKNKIPGQFMSMEKIKEAYDKACWKYQHENAKYYITVDQYSAVYPTEYLDHTMLYQTKTGTYRITKAYEDVLTKGYRDYRQVPTLENRLKELLNSYRKLKYHHSAVK